MPLPGATIRAMPGDLEPLAAAASAPGPGAAPAVLAFAGGVGLVAACVNAWWRLRRVELRRWRSGQMTYRGLHAPGPHGHGRLVRLPRFPPNEAVAPGGPDGPASRSLTSQAQA